MIKKQRMKIQLSKLELNKGQLDWLPKNPRRWTKEAIQRMVASLDEDPDFMEDRPPLVVPLGEDAKRWVVFGGNMRVEAEKARKAVKELDCIAYFPDVTDEEHRDTIIRRAMKDNGSYGEMDWDTWNTSEWADYTDRMDEWGLQAPVWEDEDEEEPSVEEDDFDETKDEIHVRCKRGEVWQLGEHRLMCGDSIDLQDVMKLMGGVEADMVFTDPPYGVSYTDKNEFLNRIGKPLACVNPIQNDHQSPTEMHDFWVKVFDNVSAVMKDTAIYYVTSPQGGDLLLLLQAINETPLALKHTLIWNKNNHVLGRCDYNYKHEPILYGWKKKGTHHFYGAGKFKTTVWDIDKPLKNDLHPTMKPVELVANCLLDGTKSEDIVLDVFGGSGTTLIAAEQLGRKCRMMELDPHYCDVIIARWEKLTGQEAVLVES